MEVSMPRSAKRVATGAAVALLILCGTSAAAEATPTGTPVHIVAHTSFDSDESAFDSSVSGCETGTVVSGDDVVVNFTPWGGVFNGAKEFTCTGGDSGFTLRLKARFGDAGSTGTWTVADGWGDFEGLRGSGTLVGIPADQGIDDVYTGSFR
jgi:hypothetical protein